ncbi:AMP-binding protein [Streptomyces durbertensis]|uniref:AMP-binding protein n=1 Tax=Streptomyces durbertensis TaxID=2448886 RepID=A0ABR6EGS6_9ACTN|nr:AMP-binding protein [Streptomyces durbertensis]MBB1244185.1 AMP-binding protein [Streptomyces durbertensis]
MPADQSNEPVQDPRFPTPPEPGAEFVHLQLLSRARQATRVLEHLGVRSGDRVAVLLPMAPESVVVTMACGRVDATRVTLPLGEPAGLLRNRIRQSGARVVITADSCHHGERRYAAKHQVDRALAGLDRVRSVLVVHRMPGPVPWHPKRDLWWHEALDTLGA